MRRTVEARRDTAAIPIHGHRGEGTDRLDKPHRCIEAFATERDKPSPHARIHSRVGQPGRFWQGNILGVVNPPPAKIDDVLWGDIRPIDRTRTDRRGR
jgi:hypothetical protein